jgi:hypothetical protein
MDIYEDIYNRRYQWFALQPEEAHRQGLAAVVQAVMRGMRDARDPGDE